MYNTLVLILAVVNVAVGQNMVSDQVMAAVQLFREQYVWGLFVEFDQHGLSSKYMQYISCILIELYFMNC